MPLLAPLKARLSPRLARVLLVWDLMHIEGLAKVAQFVSGYLFDRPEVVMRIDAPAERWCRSE